MEDGNNIADIDQAINNAENVIEQSTIIEVQTEISYGQKFTARHSA